VYVFERPEFQSIVQHNEEIGKYRPKGAEELSVLNVPVPSGETRTLYIAFLVGIPDPAVDGVLFNAKLTLNTGQSFKLSKFVKITNPN
jgi:hypothetical protein